MGWKKPGKYGPHIAQVVKRSNGKTGRVTAIATLNGRNVVKIDYGKWEYADGLRVRS